MLWNESAWIAFFAGAALKSTAVLGAAWLTVFLLRRRSAAARHLVWTAASAALLALPFLSVTLPALPVTMARAFVLPGVVFQTTAAASAEATASGVQHRTSASAPLQSRPWRPDWRLTLVLLWSAGTAVSFVRMATAWAAIGRIRRTSHPLPIVDLAALTEPLGIHDEIDVLETRPGSMPMSFGLLRPAVFLPADAAEWDQERRHMVLLHELAHVRRGDFAAHLLARTALGLYWWNPLAWIAWHEFLKEQERAADDLVLGAGAPAAEYAGHLLEIARTMQSTPAIGWAALAMARRSQLEGRLLAILDSGVNRKTPQRASAWVAALLAGAIVIPLAALRAQDTLASLPADVDATIRAAVAQKNHQILENAAKAAEALQNYDVARKLMESSLAVREDVSGQQSVDYGVGLLKLGDLERRRGHKDEARDFYTRAAAVLGNKPEAAPALIYLGLIAGAKKDFDQAFDYFERAKLVDSAKSGEAMMWMAVAREHQGNMDDADFLFRKALAVEDPNSPEAATVMRVYAQFMEQQGREDEAKSMRDQALAIRKAQGARAIATVRASASPNVYRIGNGVTPPSVLSKVEPEYSDEARAAKLQGTETVYGEIGPDGVIRNITIITGVGLGLDEKGVAAINQWRFKPGTKDGQPVTVAVNIEINFKLM